MSYLVEFEQRVRAPRKPLTLAAVQLIAEECCAEFGISHSQLSNHKTPEAIGAYMVFCYIARKLTNISQQQVAIKVGLKDHSTISASCDKIADRMVRNPKYRDAIDDLIQSILAKGGAYVQSSDYLP